MFEKLRCDACKVELGIQNLRQELVFVMNNYDYHHKNNEKAIIEEKLKLLEETEHTCKQVKEDFGVFERVLNEAAEMVEFVDEKIKQTINKFNIDLLPVSSTMRDIILVLKACIQ